MKYATAIVLAALLGDAQAVHMNLFKKEDEAANVTVTANATEPANATVSANATLAKNTTVATNNSIESTVTSDAKSRPGEPEWAAAHRAKKVAQDERLEDEAIARWEKKLEEDKLHHEKYKAVIKAAKEEIAASPMPELDPYPVPRNPVSYDGVSKAMVAGKNTNATTPVEIETANTSRNSSANASSASNSKGSTNKTLEATPAANSTDTATPSANSTAAASSSANATNTATLTKETPAATTEATPVEAAPATTTEAAPTTTTEATPAATEAAPAATEAAAAA